MVTDWERQSTTMWSARTTLFWPCRQSPASPSLPIMTWTTVRSKVMLTLCSCLSEELRPPPPQGLFFILLHSTLSLKSACSRAERLGTHWLWLNLWILAKVQTPQWSFTSHFLPVDCEIVCVDLLDLAWRIMWISLFLQLSLTCMIVHMAHFVLTADMIVWRSLLMIENLSRSFLLWESCVVSCIKLQHGGWDALNLDCDELQHLAQRNLKVGPEKRGSSAQKVDCECLGYEKGGGGATQRQQAVMCHLLAVCMQCMLGNGLLCVSFLQGVCYWHLLWCASLYNH